MGPDRRDPAGGLTTRRVAALADVHGNAPALEAVLEEVEREQPDLLVFCGDLTWGPLPEETIALLRSLDALYVRGNAESELLRLFAQVPDDASERQRFLVDRHDAAARDFVTAFREHVAVEVDGLGPTCFCHGSPRSDEELVTPETPEERMRALHAVLEEDVLVTAHTHLQFDRRVAGFRSVNAGSVGMPYEGRDGAYWAVLGPDVELRRTAYSLEDVSERYRASGDPLAEQMVEILVTPPSREELIAHAEGLEFSG